jgi:hypothetical protein
MAIDISVKLVEGLYERGSPAGCERNPETIIALIGEVGQVGMAIEEPGNGVLAVALDLARPSLYR